MPAGFSIFTKILLPTLEKTVKTSPKGNVRTINVSSDGHAKLALKAGIDLSNINMKGNHSVWAQYCQSKLADGFFQRI
jgi:hypothetical protein